MTRPQYPPTNRGVLTGGRRRNHMMRSIRSRVHDMLWTSKRRKVATVASTVALMITTAAVAYVILGVTGSGSQTVTAGNEGAAAMNVTVSGVDEGVVPGQTIDQNQQVQAWVANPTNSKVTLTAPCSLSFKVNGQDAAPGEFTVQDSTVPTFPLTLDPLQGTGGTHGQPINCFDGSVHWNDLSDVDQTSELGKPLVVTATVH